MLAQNHGNFDQQIKLTPTIVEKIQWWNTHGHQSQQQVIIPSPEYIIESDVSNSGWGGATKIEHKLQKASGCWSHDEMRLHINVKELKAAFLMLQTFFSKQSNTHIRFKLDTTAIARIKRMASTKPSLMSLLYDMWQWALSRQITLSAEHLPGVMNTVADRESQKTDLDTEWMLKSHIF